VAGCAVIGTVISLLLAFPFGRLVDRYAAPVGSPSASPRWHSRSSRWQRPSAKTPRVMATPLLAIGQTGPNYFALYLGAVVLAVLGALAVLPIKNVR
jgi:hypothetical protein